MIPSLFPLYDFGAKRLRDGSVVAACSFCKKSIHTKPECIAHYKSLLQRGPGFYQCPFGFTTRSFTFDGRMFAVTGVIAFPRFDTSEERDMAKRFPEVKISRENVEKVVEYLEQTEALRADAIQSAAKVLPQAFHELRKLNGAILQHAEKELNANNAPALQTIKSAAELMRNNFDILEALSNIEVMRALPLDATINIYDLAWKTKKVLDSRARPKHIQITLNGVRAIVPGSQKSFPIVPAVLIENAIKYSRENSIISVEVAAIDSRAILSVENETEHPIDCEKCFERGTRYAGQAAEGGGFGLFLAKEIVIAHRGRIRCEKSADRIRMIVELPLETVISENRAR
jgi:signal transduction histidine kinase